MQTQQNDFKHHISQRYNEELEEVRTRFLSMGGLVELQVEDALHALLDLDSVKAVAVQEKDILVNQKEIEIDAELVRILALRQPAASDLRMVMAVSKSITDLERIGDEAVKVGRMAEDLTREGESPRGYMEVRHIGAQVRLMLRDALDAFARLDIEQALTVIQADADIDLEYQSAMRTLMTYMMEDPRYMTRVLNVLWVLRALERIGDHARNICEQIIYMVNGADIRHTNIAHIEYSLLKQRPSSQSDRKET